MATSPGAFTPLANPALANLGNEVLRDYYGFWPTTAAALGLHAYDGQLPDFSLGHVAQREATLRRQIARLDALVDSSLAPDDLLDRDLLRANLALELFQWSQLRSHEQEVMLYLNVVDASNYIKRDYAPLADRVRSLTAFVRAVPDLLSTARATLEPALPHPHLRTAQEMVQGAITFHRGDLAAAVDRVGEASLIDGFARVNQTAVDAYLEFDRFLESRLRGPDAPFAIGDQNYRTMLRCGEMVGLPLEELVRIGEAELRRTHDAYAEAAARIDPSLPVSEVARLLAANHPSAEDLLVETRAMLDGLRQCVIDRGLVTIPPGGNLRVEETPPFLRWAFAMMDPPGPFEERATEAFYYVTPVEPEWTDQQKEEWLGKFDRATLWDVSVHEAYPGHYVHLSFLRSIPSCVRQTFLAYSFVEGWAHYCEELMLDAGCGGDDPRRRLAQLGEALLRLARYLNAIRMHTAGLSVAEATRFFQEEAFMDHLPAQKEAERGTFDPGYLNYSLGKLMVRKLRRDVEAERGPAFQLRAFHDELLSLGGPPIPLVRRRLLRHDDGVLL
ncbi:MAG: DUF885 domain-containing protein [Chloroflexi bacterium]|nr:DUF885 domain-containing protein [Chloroflexota bacterium]